MSEIPQNFMDYVQAHERVWGMESYPKRPTLAQILEATYVVFWQKIGPENLQNRRYTVTLHEDMLSIERFYGEMLFSTKFEVPAVHIHRIFHQGKRLKVTGLQIHFEAVEVEDKQENND